MREATEMYKRYDNFNKDDSVKKAKTWGTRGADVKENPVGTKPVYKHVIPAHYIY